MPLVEPILIKKMLPNGIDSLLLQVANLPRVYKSASFPSALSTLACEVDTHQLGHTFGEDFSNLHGRLAEDKHSISLMLRLVELTAQNNKASSRGSQQSHA